MRDAVDAADVRDATDVTGAMDTMTGVTSAASAAGAMEAADVRDATDVTGVMNTMTGVTSAASAAGAMSLGGAMWWLPGAVATRAAGTAGATDAADAMGIAGATGDANEPAITLRWFAAEDEGRTEQPTEQKIRTARQEGKVAKSVDLNAAIILLASALTVAIFSRYLLTTLLEMMQFFLGRSGNIELLDSGLFSRLIFRYFTRLVAPVLIVATVAALFANLIQVGFLFTTKPLRPDLKRVVPNFGRYLRRVLFSNEAGFNLLKSWFKLAIIGVVGVANVLTRYEAIIHALHVPVAQSTLLIARMAFGIMAQAAVIMLILALFDVQFQRYLHRESLRMTPHEVKEERKTQEGDPLIRNRMRQRLQSILNSNMVRNVPKADVVITNPTHYAVALEYESVRMEAPTVIAKGSDVVAQRIRDVAREHHVPLVENKLLARALHDEVEIGDTIPEKFYEAVVTILAELYRLNGIPVGAA